VPGGYVQFFPGLCLRHGEMTKGGVLSTKEVIAVSHLAEFSKSNEKLVSRNNVMNVVMS
jgi:hypothetical protein